MYKLLKPNSWMATGESPFFYNDQIVDFGKNDSVCVTTCNYQVADTSCGVIFEGFGQENFIIPGDTMDVGITPLTKDSADAMLKVYWPTRLARLTFSGTNKYVYELFDSLQYFIGRDIRYLQNVPIAREDDTTNCYSLATGQYKNRVDFLNAYCKRHDVPDRFKKLALSEMHALYLSNLIVPIYAYGKKKSASARFPDYYLKAIEQEQLTDEGLYFNTALYGYAAFDYWLHIAAKDDSVSAGKSTMVFTSMYKLVKDNCSDSMREHLLGYLLTSYAERGYSVYDSLLQDYNRICKDKALLTQVNDAAEKEKERGRKIREITFEKALATEVEDVHGKKHALKDELDKKKFTVVDCWASWCGPCLSQLPYTKKMEQKYRKDFTFVFLSFDRNKNDWNAKINQLKINKNTYLLSEGFKSNLAYHFGINSIPRYLIFDSHGNVVNTNASRPSKPEFEEILNKLMAENKSISAVR